MENQLRVGVGREIITPSLGTLLYGYAPGRPAESVNDDLRVTCLALADGERQAMLISADICTYGEENAEHLRVMIEEQTGIPARLILFNVTHTHSGPATNASAGWGVTNDAYRLEQLEPAIVRAAKTAQQSLQPARMGVGTINSKTAINRRQLNRDGTISLGQNPWAPYDPVMTVVSFVSEKGDPLANLVHYCCHGTAAGVSPEITRDWSGPMVDCLEEQSGAISVFFGGAEGDVGPRLPNGRTTGNLKMALELGARAGFDAVTAWRSIRDYRDVALGTFIRDLELPYKPLADKETALQAMHNLGDPDKLKGMNLKIYDKWNRVIEEHGKNQPIEQHKVLKQTLVAIGPVVFVPFPYELFVEITLRIRQLSPFQYTLCLSNTNGSYGYFPTLDQYSRGGYEVQVARYFNAYELAENADDIVVQKSVQMLDDLDAAMQS